MRSNNTQSEKRTGEDAAIVLIARVWFIAASIGTQSILAWTLAPEGRGAYAVCFIFGTLFGVLFTCGTDRGAQYSVMSRGLTVSQAASAAAVIAVTGSIAAMGLGWFLIHTPFSFFQKAATSDFELSLLLIPLSLLNTVFMLQMNGLKRFVARGVIVVIQTTTTLALSAVFLGLLGLGVKGALWAQAIGLALGIALQVRDLSGHCGFTVALPQWQQLRPILFYGARFFVARLGAMVNLQLGVIFLALVASQNEIGLFSAASALAVRTLIIPESIEVSILPRIYAELERRHDLVGRAIRITGLFMGVTLGFLVIVSVPLVDILLSPQFLPAVPLIWILVPGIFALGWSTILMGYFRATNRPGLISWCIWTGLVVSATLLVVLYPHMGVSAAAWALTLGFAVRAVALIVCYHRISGAGVVETFRPQYDDLVLLNGYAGRMRTRLSTLGRARHERT